MNKKLIIGITVVGIIVLAAVFIPRYSSITGNTACSGDVCTININSDIEKVEVYHFHGTHQCWSCKTLGAYAEETTNTRFSEELKSGKLVFGHINIDEPKNKALVEKYGARGSSLIIGVYGTDGSFTKEENTNVWYKLNDKKDFTTYLSEVIKEKLAGK